MIRVLIADDHTIVRIGLAALLNAEDDIEVVGEAKNGDMAVKEAFFVLGCSASKSIFGEVVIEEMSSKLSESGRPSANSCISTPLIGLSDSNTIGMVTEVSLGV